MRFFENEKISRRDFLKISAVGTVSSVLAGCASGGLPLVLARADDDQLRIALAEAPALALPHGAVAVASPERGELHLIIFKRGENDYIAVSSICTHLGCRVRKAREGFECPCHGSRYDLEGKVVNGPAARPLTQFPVRRENGELVITL